MPRYAAIDIGSNSIRLLVADALPGGRIEVLADDREVTRLGESVFRAGAISPEALALSTAVLARMAQAYRKLNVVAVRAVATAAVRDASNQLEFIERASAVLGASVEIISGQEEARLIHLGVRSRWPQTDKPLLIIDIGGGSAEVILSERARLREAFTRPLGAVRLTSVFLKDDPPKPQQLSRMNEFIREKLAPAVDKLGVRPAERVIATSATAAATVCAANRIPRARRDEADRRRATTSQIRRLYEELCRRGAAARARITGVGPRRAEIIIPGVAVLLHCLEAFRLPALHYSVAGVRDGIVADLAARRVGADLARLSREQRRSVEQMASRYAVPLRHARKVAALAEVLFESLRPLHRLPPYWGKLLEAASILYEAGLYVSETAHHKHSQYLVANSDLPGFTDRERNLVSLLTRFHRKSMPGARHTAFQALPAEDRRALLYLVPLLRLADALDHSKEQRVEAVRCELRDGVCAVRIQSSGPADLEEWAAQGVGEVFAQVFGQQLAVSRIRR